MTTPKISPFAAQVYQRLRGIPAGKVTTYGNLAASIGCRSAQAVGQALRANPFAPEVPCHRVVRSDGSLGGYSGETSGETLQRKVDYLREEGVKFLADGRVDLQASEHRFPAAGDLRPAATK